MKKAILLFLMVSCWVFANAQQKTISGTISDESGSPLPGVNVVLKGTTVGTITDLDGNYSLEVPSDETILVISYLGYLSEEIQVGGQTTIDLTLTPSLEALEEVVVIGYGSVKKKDLTGAIAQVGGEDIASRNSTQISQALQGAMPGVTVTRNSSAPGATGTIRIRGITTMSNNDPLVIVDGVPGFNIDDVNPSDIENITVLKDAAAASIYGSQAAAGVILITTKRAKEGTTQLEYNFQYGVQVPTELPEYVGSQRYMEMYNEMNWNDKGNPAGREYFNYDSVLIATYLDSNRVSPNMFPVTDWTDKILNDYATRQKHNLSFSVGGGAIKSFGSIAYETSDALYDHRTYERYNVRLNNNIDVNKFMSADIDLAYKRVLDEQPTANPLGGMRILPPIYAADWNDGRMAPGREGKANPYAALHEGGFKDKTSDAFNGKLGIYLKPFEGLKLSGIISPKVGFIHEKNFRKRVPYYSASDKDKVNPSFINDYDRANLEEKRNNRYNVTSQFLANYKKTFYSSHNFDFLLGYEYQYIKHEDLKSKKEDFELDTYPYLDLGPEESQSSEGSANHLKRESVFGRLMYNYQNRYYVQANLRYDGSSRFRKEDRWGSFPSLSVGWVISEEAFMANIPVLSFLKLRASYGVLGNERISNDWYPYLALLNFDNILIYEGNDIKSRLSAGQFNWAISNLTWETTRTLDLGIDVNFIDNKLRLTADYYNKITSDMLLEAEMPDHSGYDNAQRNAGEMSSKGWEFVVSWKDRIGEVGYSASFHMSDNKTEMLEMGDKKRIKDNRITEKGSEFKEWYGLVSDGLWQSQEEIDEAVAGGLVLYDNPEPGDVRYKDVDGNDTIHASNDRAYLGGSLPRYTYGGTVKLDYKGIDFSMVFQGVGKQTEKLSQYMVRPLVQGYTSIPGEVDGKYWSMYNSKEQNKGATYPRLTNENGSRNYTMSDYWLFDGSYFRIKNITIGYTIPKDLTQRIRLSKVRVYASAIDVLSINNYIKGWDPEVTQDSHPITRTFLFGAQVKF